jgi:hypothetical protein
MGIACSEGRIHHQSLPLYYHAGLRPDQLYERPNHQVSNWHPHHYTIEIALAGTNIVNRIVFILLEINYFYLYALITTLLDPDHKNTTQGLGMVYKHCKRSEPKLSRESNIARSHSHNIPSHFWMQEALFTKALSSIGIVCIGWLLTPKHQWKPKWLLLFWASYYRCNNPPMCLRLEM